MDRDAAWTTANEKRRLLIVEDDAPIAKLFSLILGATFPEIEIVETSDANEALSAINEKCPALIITDVNMPGMNGAVLYREIERICTGNAWDLPAVVFCTGNAHQQAIREIVSSNPAHCILAKPVTRDALVAVVEPRL